MKESGRRPCWRRPDFSYLLIFWPLFPLRHVLSAFVALIVALDHRQQTARNPLNCKTRLFCKQLGINYDKLSKDEFVSLINISK